MHAPAMMSAFLSPAPLPISRGSRCSSRVRACAVLAASNAAQTDEVQAHPGYKPIRTPHLVDYLPDLISEPSPLLQKRLRKGFVSSSELILSSVVTNLHSTTPVRAFTRAGPRERVYYGAGVRAAIVSCGGICPGINTVIREVTLCLHQYDVGAVLGVQHGYRGFHRETWRTITRADVEGMHKVGGTMLGSSRGGFDLMRIVDAIETREIDQVYVIGGDGTIMGCQKIFHEVRRRGMKTAIISIPKTIDNDVAVIDRSFGTSLCD